MATHGYMRPHPSLLLSSNQVYVDKSGNDTTGNGSVDNPYLTIGAAYTAAAALSTINIGPGTYAETLTLSKQVNLVADIPGTVTIQGTVAAGAVVTVSGAAIGCVIEGINITNLSNVGLNAIGLLVNNTGATITGPIIYRYGTISSGAGASCAFSFIGAAGGGLRVDIRGSTTTGSLLAACAHANDLVWFNDVVANGGLATWGRVSGTAGRVIMSNFLMHTATTEVLNFGNGAACGVTLSIGASVLACTLDMNNNAGAGVVTVTDGSQIARITCTLANQIIQRWMGEDRLAVTILNVDANTLGARTMFTVPGGRTFAPYTSRCFNKAAATAGTTNYQVNGSGAASVVAGVGAGAVGTGVVNLAVLPTNTIAPAGTVQFQITGAGGAGSALNCYVEGILI